MNEFPLFNGNWRRDVAVILSTTLVFAFAVGAFFWQAACVLDLIFNLEPYLWFRNSAGVAGGAASAFWCILYLAHRADV